MKKRTPKKKGKYPRFVRLVNYLIILSFFLTAANSVYARYNGPYVDYPRFTQHSPLEFGELDSMSDLVVKVKISNDLTEKGSTVTYLDGPDGKGTPSSYSGTRTGEVIELIAGNAQEFPPGSSVTFLEPAAKSSDRYLIRDEDYYPVENSKTYILFLALGEDGNYELVAGANGVLPIDNFVEANIATETKTSRALLAIAAYEDSNEQMAPGFKDSVPYQGEEPDLARYRSVTLFSNLGSGGFNLLVSYQRLADASVLYELQFEDLFTRRLSTADGFYEALEEYRASQNTPLPEDTREQTP